MESVPSLAVITTLLAPIALSPGVPASTPVDAVKVSHEGTVVPVRVTVFELGSPSSASVAVTVYEYAVSSVPVVTAVLVNAGASFWSDTMLN